jgi:DNA-binding LacI/PurR family transcriptional regulator
MHDAGVQVVHSLLTTGDALTRWVRIVQDDICQQQVQALVVAGHRRLAYAMPDDERLRAEIELRRKGVRRACAERGLPEPVVSTVPAELNAAAAIISSWRAMRGPSPACAPTTTPPHSRSWPHCAGRVRPHPPISPSSACTTFLPPGWPNRR